MKTAIPQQKIIAESAKELYEQITDNLRAIPLTQVLYKVSDGSTYSQAVFSPLQKETELLAVRDYLRSGKKLGSRENSEALKIEVGQECEKYKNSLDIAF